MIDLVRPVKIVIKDVIYNSGRIFGPILHMAI